MTRLACLGVAVVAVMLALGLEQHGGAVRAGFLHYTTQEEVDRLCDLVAQLAARA